VRDRRTLQRLRRPARRPSNLFGIIDVIALDPERGVVGVQSCGQAFAAHERTMLEERPRPALDWLETPVRRSSSGAGARSSWPRGKAMRWQPRVRVFTLADFLRKWSDAA
jgi:hypothetical protein